MLDSRALNTSHRMTVDTLHVVGRRRTTTSVVTGDTMPSSRSVACASREWDAPSTVVAPAVVLETCERHECYWWGDVSQAKTMACWSATSAADVDAPLMVLSGDDALAHLIAVASGLRSSRFGEPEILGQVRNAWRDAQERGGSHAQLDSVLRTAIGAARHIRRQLGASANDSIGDATTRLIRRQLANMMAPAYSAREQSAREHARVRVLVIGAGEVGESVSLALAHSGIDGLSVTVTNRTPARAARLAARVGAQCLPWTDVPQTLPEADVVVSAVRSAQPIITASMATQVLHARAHATLWVDLATPPNIAADIAHERLLRRSLADLSIDTEHDVTRASVLLESEMQRVRRARDQKRAFNDDHSCRMASMGLSRAARCAG